MVRTIEGLQHELLDRYDSVLVTDVDEIVAPSPGWGTLSEYIGRFDEEFVNCLGYEVIHLVDRERPFDPARPVLDQRGYWFANDSYDKPALATEPMRWEPGFHAREDGRMRLDPDLFLVHLHRMDYETCLARHRYRRGRAWNDVDLAENWATHNLIGDEAEFARWFYEDSCFENIPIVVEPIPRRLEGPVLGPRRNRPSSRRPAGPRDAARGRIGLGSVAARRARSRRSPPTSTRSILRPARRQRSAANLMLAGRGGSTRA